MFVKNVKKTVMCNCMKLKTYPSKLRNNLVESIPICVGDMCR